MRFYDGLDWSRPWYRSVLEAARSITAAADWRAALNARAALGGLTNQQVLPLRFVPQAALPEGTAYEAFIHDQGQVPTRENLHDFFNALVWLSFPRIKVQLNALQAAQIALSGVGKSRGAARDGATLFDENAALIVVRAAPEATAWVEALRSHQWKTVFGAQRARFENDCQVWLFGHALMEKLAAPYKAITAHAWIVTADDAFFALPLPERRAWIDERVAQELAQHGVTPERFTPLPVLGVPGWWPLQDDDFYADASVFRPPRVRKVLPDC